MLLAVADDNGRHYSHHCGQASPNSIKYRGQHKLINFYIIFMILLNLFNSGVGLNIRKAARPYSGMDSSNPRHWRGERLHHHGDGVCHVVCAFCAVSSGLHHSWYVDKYKRTLTWSYGCDKKVSHPGLHHSGNQVDKLLADVEDKLLVVDNDGDVKGPMSANGNSQVEEHLTVKRKVVAPRHVRQSTQQSTNIKVMCVMLSTGIEQFI